MNISKNADGSRWSIPCNCRWSKPVNLQHHMIIDFVTCFCWFNFTKFDFQTCLFKPYSFSFQTLIFVGKSWYLDSFSYHLPTKKSSFFSPKRWTNLRVSNIHRVFWKRSGWIDLHVLQLQSSSVYWETLSRCSTSRCTFRGHLAISRNSREPWGFLQIKWITESLVGCSVYIDKEINIIFTYLNIWRAYG